MIKEQKKYNERAKIVNDKLKINLNNTWVDISLEDYEDIVIIGAGANSIALAGCNRKTFRKDAIKIYTPNANSRDGKVSIEQYLREVRKLASLNDPRIVTVYDAKDIGSNIHIVTMEYIEGQTLTEWLKNKTAYHDEQDWFDRLQLAKKILNTVLYYQSKGIIHGDLHCGNILIDNNWDIHIIDFGTSLFAKVGQSNCRESYFIYDLTRKILAGGFDKKYFTFDGTKRILDKIVENDVREKQPILVTKTMLAYIEAMDLMLQLPTSDLKPYHIVNVCVALTDGIYIAFEYAIKKIYLDIEKRIPINSIAEIISANIDEHNFPEDIADFSTMEQLFDDSLEIYYQMAMEIRDKWDVEKSKQYTFSHTKGIITDSEYDMYMQMIMNSEVDTYNSFMPKRKYEIDDKYRLILSGALDYYMGPIRFGQELWIRLNEKQCMRMDTII